MPNALQDTAASAVASKTTMVGSTVTVAGWATHSDFGMWVGIVIGVLGLVVNFYYRFKSDRRAAEAHRRYLDHIDSQTKQEAFRRAQDLYSNLPPQSCEDEGDEPDSSRSSM